jgi:hypothetical protein
VAGTAPRDLDGRPAASARVCPAYVAGIFDGALGRRRARRRDDASEGRLDAAQRLAAQRPRHDDGPLPPLRRPHDARDDRRRSRLPHRAARETNGSAAARRLGAVLCDPAIEIVAMGSCRTICPDRSTIAEFGEAHGLPREATRRRRDGVTGIRGTLR